MNIEKINIPDDEFAAEARPLMACDSRDPQTWVI